MILPTGGDGSKISPPIKQLSFDLDDYLQKEIHDANLVYQALFNSIRCIGRIFKGYGKGILKQHRLHPEAFVQVVLQAAYIKLHEKVAPTYCTATTRKFAHGRTETCRSCTTESVEFANKLFDNCCSVSSSIYLYL